MVMTLAAQACQIDLMSDLPPICSATRTHQSIPRYPGLWTCTQRFPASCSCCYNPTPTHSLNWGLIPLCFTDPGLCPSLPIHLDASLLLPPKASQSPAFSLSNHQQTTFVAVCRQITPSPSIQLHPALVSIRAVLTRLSFSKHIAGARTFSYLPVFTFFCLPSLHTTLSRCRIKAS